MMKMLKIFYAAPLLVATIYGVLKLYTGFGLNTTAEILSRISVLFIVAFCVYVITLLLKDKPLATITQWIMYGIILITVISALYIGFGYIQEINGAICRGFFNTELNCVESKNLILHIFLLGPFALIPFGLASLIGIQQQIEKGYHVR